MWKIVHASIRPNQHLHKTQKAQQKETQKIEIIYKFTGA